MASLSLACYCKHERPKPEGGNPLPTPLGMGRALHREGVRDCPPLPCRGIASRPPKATPKSAYIGYGKCET